MGSKTSREHTKLSAFPLVISSRWIKYRDMSATAFFRNWIVPLVSFAACGLLVGCASPAQALEYVLANMDGREKQFRGEVIYEDSLGGMLLRTDEGGMWTIEASSIENRRSDDQPLQPLDKQQLAQRLLEEMGSDFQAHDSKNYVVVYNTTRKYAMWTSSLLERLQAAFLDFWSDRGLEVHQPTAPLAVLIFANKDSYLQYAKRDLGASAGNAIGYYSLQTNRIVMYDLTGLQAWHRQNNQRGSSRNINQILRQPEAVRLVATIVHEATHQIAFNCGVQKRYVDNPVWLGEGLAMFFETPDLTSSRSWRGIGNVNYERWDRLRRNANLGKMTGIKELVADDQPFRNPLTAVDAYAEAWAWNYFLIKWHPNEYTNYLRMISEKPLLAQDDRETRIAEFKKHFGDFDDLKREFYQRMSRID